MTSSFALLGLKLTATVLYKTKGRLFRFASYGASLEVDDKTKWAQAIFKG